MRRREWLWAAVAVASGGPARAQDPVFRAGASVVSVTATVRDAKGRLVGDLERDDFLVEEETGPQAIRYFSRQRKLPLVLGFLLDSSSGDYQVLAAEQSACARFIARVVRPARDSHYMVSFSREVEVMRYLGGESRPLRQFFQRANTAAAAATEGPALYDAIVAGSAEMARRTRGQRALIVLSDGADAASRAGIDDAVAAAQRAEAIVYTLLFQGPGAGSGGARQHRAILQQIAGETGGAAFEFSGRAKLNPVFERIEEELRNQYSLGYSPDPQGPAGGAFREIRVTVKRPGLVARTRRGYYS